MIELRSSHWVSSLSNDYIEYLLKVEEDKSRLKRLNGEKEDRISAGVWKSKEAK